MISLLNKKPRADSRGYTSIQAIWIQNQSQNVSYISILKLFLDIYWKDVQRKTTAAKSAKIKFKIAIAKWPVQK